MEWPLARWGAFSLLRQSRGLRPRLARRALALLAVLSLAFAPGAAGRSDGVLATIDYTLSGTQGENGWWVSNVTIHWVVTPPPDSSDCPIAQLVPGDTAGTTRTCSATWADAGTRTATTAVIKIDKTAPTSVAGAAARAPNGNGWYRAAVDVSFNGSDAMSGIASCTSTNYGGPDGADRSIPGSCRDNAGNVTAAAFSLDYDATNPAVTAKTPSRLPDRNGWYNHDLTVTYTGDDATSGIASCDTPAYGAPDDATASITGVCRDRAGNTSAASTFAFKYDETAPNVSSTADHAPNAAGWYRTAVTISFDATDTVSGKDTCDPAKTYGSPDSATASVTGTCRDIAGNSGSRTHPLKYDETNPSVDPPVPTRDPDANGWFNQTITFSVGGRDNLSGIQSGSCSAPGYSGPDDATAAVSGTCRDVAGNTGGSAPYAFKYDETAPTVTTSADRAPNANGWYREPVTVSFAGADSLSGFDSCDAPKSYGGPDSASASLSGSCRDRAGNSASRAHALKYDATPPSATGAEAERPPDAAGWYRDPVEFSFSGSDETSGPVSCPPQTYSGPDKADATVAGTCTDRAGNRSAPLTSATFEYDATAPAVTRAIPSRAANATGWYRRPVGFTFEGTDATSGGVTCSPASYGGPDSASARVTGRCEDAAGNLGARGFPLKYDAVAPTVRATFSRRPDRYGWYSHDVRIGFAGADRVSGIASCSPARLYRGPNGAAAAVGGACTDRAGNRGERTFRFKYSEPLLFPRAGTRVGSPPLLDWVSVANARYFNVQVWRDGKRLSRWPAASQFQLRRTWTFNGRRYTLTPGRYTWYVWPRFAGRYGRMIGGSAFIVQ